MVIKATTIVKSTGETLEQEGKKYHVMLRIRDGKEKKFLRDDQGNEYDFAPMPADVSKACRLMYRDKKTDKLVDNQDGETKVLSIDADGNVLSINTMVSSKGDVKTPLLCYFKLNKTEGTYYPSYKMPIDLVKIAAKDIAI